MRGLYAIVDVTTLAARGIDVVEFARAVAAARPAAIQLRAKDASPREILALLRAIGPACRQAQVPLYANDRADLAVLGGCDGVHVGQDDLPPAVVRRIAPELRIGISTHDLAQVALALAEAPDYIAFGPIFGTRSKANPDPVVGLDALGRVAAQSNVPVVAIGGIDVARGVEIAKLAGMGAVISALVPDDLAPGNWDVVTERARELHRALGG